MPTFTTLQKIGLSGASVGSRTFLDEAYKGTAFDADSNEFIAVFNLF